VRITMKNTLNYLIALAVLLVAPQFAIAQQNNFTQTTLSAAVAGGSVNVGTPAPTYVQVTSATNIVGLGPNLSGTASQPAMTSIFVDRELMSVISVSGTLLQVARGQGGTVAVPHAKGSMVLAGYPFWFSQNDPGGSGGFSGVGSSACTGANVIAGPHINTRTGAQWICSSKTGTWVPGFNNPLAFSASGLTADVASVGGATVPSGPIFHVTGTNAITSWSIPVGCAAETVSGALPGACTFITIPDAAFTWAGGGNMAATGTAVANLPIIWIWDSGNQKWVALQSK